MGVVLNEDRIQEIHALAQLMQDVLRAVESTYASANVTLPERRYWLMDTPVVDCEQVTVGFIQAYLGPPGDQASLPQPCDAIKTAVLQVQVHRCVPSANSKGKPPLPESIIVASEKLAIDAFLLLDSSSALEMWDPIGPGLGVIATIEVTEPQGGFQGVILNLTLAIP